MSARLAVLLLLAFGLAACASPARRIEKSRALFDALPPAAQQAIRAGRVEPGFTPEMATLALGAPDRAYRRRTADKEQEIWVYGETISTPGVGMIALPTGYETVWGGGIVMGAGDTSRYEERARIVFEGGKVVSVDSRLR
jgi:hypothetical protein